MSWLETEQAKLHLLYTWIDLEDVEVEQIQVELNASGVHVTPTASPALTQSDTKQMRGVLPLLLKLSDAETDGVDSPLRSPSKSPKRSGSKSRSSTVNSRRGSTTVLNSCKGSTMHNSRTFEVDLSGSTTLLNPHKGSSMQNSRSFETDMDSSFAAAWEGTVTCEKASHSPPQLPTLEEYPKEVIEGWLDKDSDSNPSGHRSISSIMSFSKEPSLDGKALPVKEVPASESHQRAIHDELTSPPKARQASRESLNSLNFSSSSFSDGQNAHTSITPKYRRPPHLHHHRNSSDRLSTDKGITNRSPSPLGLAIQNSCFNTPMSKLHLNTESTYLESNLPGTLPDSQHSPHHILPSPTAPPVQGDKYSLWLDEESEDGNASDWGSPDANKLQRKNLPGRSSKKTDANTRFQAWNNPVSGIEKGEPGILNLMPTKPRAPLHLEVSCKGKESVQRPSSQGKHTPRKSALAGAWLDQSSSDEESPSRGFPATKHVTKTPCQLQNNETSIDKWLDDSRSEAESLIDDRQPSEVSRTKALKELDSQQALIQDRPYDAGQDSSTPLQAWLNEDSKKTAQATCEHHGVQTTPRGKFVPCEQRLRWQRQHVQQDLDSKSKPS